MLALAWMVLASARLGQRDHASQPSPVDWPLGPYHWTAHYTQFVPSNVVDVCGGSVGHTKWGDVNPACYQFAVKLSMCVQSCGGTNSMGGFGDCLVKCGITPPDCSYCEGAAEPAMTTFCHEMCDRVHQCKCLEPATIPTALDFTKCNDECVSPCSTSLETELLLGVSLPWRHPKCGAGVFYSCGGDDGLQCVVTPAYECEGPVGPRPKVCYGDDPWCSDKHWVCAVPTNETVPLPAQVVRTSPEEGWAGLYYPPLWNSSNATEQAASFEIRGVPPPKAEPEPESLLARAIAPRLRRSARSALQRSTAASLQRERVRRALRSVNRTAATR